MTRIKKFYSSMSSTDDSSFRKLSCVCKGSGIRESMISLLKNTQTNDHVGGSVNGQEEAEPDPPLKEINDGIPQCDACFTPLDRLHQIKESLKKYFTSKGEGCPCTVPMNPIESAFKTFTKEPELQPIVENTSKEDILEVKENKTITTDTSKQVNGIESMQDKQKGDDIKSLINKVAQPTDLRELIEETNKLVEKESVKLNDDVLVNNRSLVNEQVKPETVLTDTDKRVTNKNVLDNQVIVEKDTMSKNLRKSDKHKKGFSLNENEEESLIKCIDWFPYKTKSRYVDDELERTTPGNISTKTSKKVSKFSWKELFPSFLSRSGSDKELKVTEYVSPNSNQWTTNSSSNPESLTSERQTCSRSLNCKKSSSFVMKLTKSTMKKKESSRSCKIRDLPVNISPIPNKAVSQENATKKHNYRYYY